jgi:hypothetical protein
MIDYSQPNNRQLIREQLASGLVRLTFTRADGTVRLMTATLAADRIPPLPAYNHAGPPNEQLQVVWDTEANAWRSFRWERLTETTAAA